CLMVLALFFLGACEDELYSTVDEPSVDEQPLVPGDGDSTVPPTFTSPSSGEGVTDPFILDLDLQTAHPIVRHEDIDPGDPGPDLEEEWPLSTKDQSDETYLFERNGGRATVYEYGEDFEFSSVHRFQVSRKNAESKDSFIERWLRNNANTDLMARSGESVKYYNYNISHDRNGELTIDIEHTDFEIVRGTLVEKRHRSCLNERSLEVDEIQELQSLQNSFFMCDGYSFWEVPNRGGVRIGFGVVLDTDGNVVNDVTIMTSRSIEYHGYDALGEELFWRDLSGLTHPALRESEVAQKAKLICGGNEAYVSKIKQLVQESPSDCANFPVDEILKTHKSI
ncbi:MAG: hypothetical protein AAF203_00825, partial [Pseudomonadota bacterium]